MSGRLIVYDVDGQESKRLVCRFGADEVLFPAMPRVKPCVSVSVAG